MSVRRALLALALLLAAATAAATLGLGPEPPDVPAPAVSEPLSVQIRATVRVRPGSGRLRLWVPLPATDESQRLLEDDLEVSVQGASAQFALTGDVHGNRFVYLAGSFARPFTVSYRATVLRHSRGAADRAELARAVARVRSDLQDGAIRFPYGGHASAALEALQGRGGNDSDELADAVLERLLAGTASASTGLERAIVLNELLRRNGRYLKVGAYGRGSPLWFCLTGQGNCTDFHFTYLDVAQQVDLHGRFRIGIPLSADPARPVAARGSVPGYHCWVYLDEPLGFGIDPAWEARLGAPTGTYFGEPFNDRIRLTQGTDLRLAPAIAGKPLRFLFEAYAELNRVPLPRHYASTVAPAPARPGVVTTYAFQRLR